MSRERIIEELHKKQENPLVMLKVVTGYVPIMIPDKETPIFRVLRKCVNDNRYYVHYQNRILFVREIDAYTRLHIVLYTL